MQAFERFVRKQYTLGRFGKYFASYYVLLGASMFWAGLFSLFLAMVTAWTVQLDHLFGGTVNFYVFVAIVAFFFGVIIPLGHHKFVMKSQCGYQTGQVWDAANPSREQLDRIEKKLDALLGEKHEN